MTLTTSSLASPARALFRRCVQCPDAQPSCPTCAADEKCSLQVKTCDSCAFTTCVKSGGPAATAAPAAAPPSPSSVGPIVGGVLGGLAAILLGVFLVWWFCIRRRKQEEDGQWRASSVVGSEKNRGSTGLERYSAARENRASTHTVASIASTMYTRASNIIQIAYIPGVTNRSAHSSPDLVPPVPPIPAISPLGSSTTGSPYHSGGLPRSAGAGGEEQHYFLPDLRASQYSAYTDRSSLARGSIASTIYRDHAVVNPLPAQAAQRARPTAVSVKGSTRTSPNLSRAASPPPPASALPAAGGPQYGNTLTPQSSNPLLRTKSSIVGIVGTPRQVTLTRKSSRNRGAAGVAHELEAPDRRASPATVSSVSPPPPAHRRGAASRPHGMEASLLDAQPDSDDEDDVSFADAASGKVSSVGSSHDSGRQRHASSRGPPSANASSIAISDAIAAATAPLAADANERAPITRGGLARDDASRASTIPEEASRPGSAVLDSLAAASGRGAREERRESLNAIIQEATRRATLAPRPGGLGFRAGDGVPEEQEEDGDVEDAEGPFSDAHAAHTP